MSLVFLVISMVVVLARRSQGFAVVSVLGNNNKKQNSLLNNHQKSLLNRNCSRRVIITTTTTTTTTILVSKMVSAAGVTGATTGTTTSQHQLRRQQQHRLITNKMCPFAQKAWIALEVSQVPYQLEEIALYGSGGKPDWFWKLNPKGTVPVLVVVAAAAAAVAVTAKKGDKDKDSDSDTVLTDSDVILNHLEQGLVPGALSLSTAGSKDAGAVQKWRTRINQMLPVAQRAVCANSMTKQLEQHLQTMDDDAPKDDTSLYLTGSQITTADCHAFPFLWRLHQEFDFSSKYPKLTAWLNHCSTKEPAFCKMIQSSWWWWWW